MKKVTFILTLIVSSFFSAQAGYVIRGIYAPSDYDNLKNYTLTFDQDGAPVAAASMHTTFSFGTGKNTIVVIQKNLPGVYLFPIAPTSETPFNDVEVRDFHYDQINNAYVLCGSRQPVSGTRRAFVARINVTFFTMDFYEYPGADMFYSICDPNTTPAAWNNYYLCGTRSTRGVIASVNKTSLSPVNFHTTDIDWEYHKIIFKEHPVAMTATRFVVSGRNPDRTQIGFTTLNVGFATVNSYYWAQLTEQRSHCVVSDDIGVNDAVILASSYQNTVTLNPVTYPIPAAASVYAVRFSLPDGRYWIQDISTIKLLDNTTRISVAGFKVYSSSSFPAHTIAWYGYVDGLSTPMKNNDYYAVLGYDFYEHYKIRYQAGNTYTGGSFQKANDMGALFGTPLTIAPMCDDRYESDYIEEDDIIKYTFSVTSGNTQSPPYNPPYTGIEKEMDSVECLPFKGGEAPKSAISVEDESEIITLYDRITLTDTPANTHYQIYNVIGQLVQTGVTNPDISTAQLGKGVYILRLESGKTFKFVK